MSDFFQKEGKKVVAKDQLHMEVSMGATVRDLLRYRIVTHSFGT